MPHEQDSIDLFNSPARVKGALTGAPPLDEVTSACPDYFPVSDSTVSVHRRPISGGERTSRTLYLAVPSVFEAVLGTARGHSPSWYAWRDSNPHFTAPKAVAILPIGLHAHNSGGERRTRNAIPYGTNPFSKRLPAPADSTLQTFETL